MDSCSLSRCLTIESSGTNNFNREYLTQPCFAGWDRALQSLLKLDDQIPRRRVTPSTQSAT
jgi:hypothetical protein